MPPVVWFYRNHQVFLVCYFVHPVPDSLPGPDVAEAAVAQQVIALLHAPTSGHLLCVTGDHNVVTVSDVTLARVGILVGYNDDIIDVKYVPSPAMDGTTSRKVAVATNSEQVRVLS